MTYRRHGLPDFIIGGTEKAGTTSVFDWLSLHPEVGASSRKETDFFRAQFTGDLAIDARRYSTFFAHCKPQQRVLMEASPGYLGEAASVSPRMNELLPKVRLLFILRDPVARFQSSFDFHRGRLNLPNDLDLRQYVQKCLAFDRGEAGATELGLDEWYLKVLRFGCYAEHVDTYRRQAPDATLKLMFFEDLRDDPVAFMTELSESLGIDADFWARFNFRPSNVTFAGRNEWLHRFALRSNAAFEPWLRRAPGVKRTLLRAYKALNRAEEEHDPMPADVRDILDAYYRPTMLALQSQAARELPPAWMSRLSGRVAA